SGPLLHRNWRAIARPGACGRHVLNHFSTGSVDSRLDDSLALTLTIGLARSHAEVLVASLISNIQHYTPDKISGKTAQQQYNQHRQSLPQIRRTVFDGKRLYGISHGQSVRNDCAHSPRTHAHAN